MSGAALIVDTAAIAANTRTLLARSRAEVMAVVKADGYGAGAQTVARAALGAGASWLGVTSVAEALALRGAGFGQRMLSWLNPVDADFTAAVHADVDVAVPGVGHLDAVVRAARAARRSARVHLQVDCGMAREGASAAQWPLLCAYAAAAAGRGDLEVVGVMGHLSSADRPGDRANRLERARFARALRVAASAGLAPRHRHLAATAAGLTQPSARHTLVRAGAGLIGIDPTGAGRLRGALTLTAPVISVRDVAAGTPVGYDHAWTAPSDTRLALVAAGYADGVPRRLDGQAQLLLRGIRRRVVGRVSMDQLVVDLGALDVTAGERATVFGPGDAGEPTLADWAAWSGTIPNEIVTGVGARVSRLPVPSALRAAS